MGACDMLLSSACCSHALQGQQYQPFRWLVRPCLEALGGSGYCKEELLDVDAVDGMGDQGWLLGHDKVMVEASTFNTCDPQYERSCVLSTVAVER